MKYMILVHGAQQEFDAIDTSALHDEAPSAADTDCTPPAPTCWRCQATRTARRGRT